MNIGVREICDYYGYDGLGKVHRCAFNPINVGVLLPIASKEGLKEDTSLVLWFTLSN